MRLNVHFQVLWLDGVYAWELGRGAPVFVEPREVMDGDVRPLRSGSAIVFGGRCARPWMDPGEAANGADVGWQ
jgi:hypothetical protein